MKLQVEATDQIIEIDGVPVRVWRGRTSNGIECFVLIHRIAVHKSEDQAAFDRELAELLPPANRLSVETTLNLLRSIRFEGNVG